MTLFHAFIDQLCTLVITLLIGFDQLKETTEGWGYPTYISAVVFFLGIGTYVRWYFQIPLLGPFANVWAAV